MKNENLARTLETLALKIRRKQVVSIFLVSEDFNSWQYLNFGDYSPPEEDDSSRWPSQATMHGQSIGGLMKQAIEEMYSSDTDRDDFLRSFLAHLTTTRHGSD